MRAAGKPKKPLNAYMKFSATVREGNAEELKKAGKVNTMKWKKTREEWVALIKEKWVALGDEGKKLFQDAYELEKEQYAKGMAEFRKTPAYQEFLKFFNLQQWAIKVLGRPEGSVPKAMTLFSGGSSSTFLLNSVLL